MDLGLLKTQILCLLRLSKSILIKTEGIFQLGCSLPWRICQAVSWMLKFSLLAHAEVDFQGPQFLDLEKNIPMLDLKRMSSWKLSTILRLRSSPLFLLKWLMSLDMHTSSLKLKKMIWRVSFKCMFSFNLPEMLIFKTGSLDSILDATSVSWTDRLKSIQPQGVGSDPRAYTSEPEDEGDPWRRMPPPRPASTNPFVDCTHESINRSQLMNYRLPPDTCFETAFTTESPTTRVVHTGTLKFCKARLVFWFGFITFFIEQVIKISIRNFLWNT
jgi:hypothetical protein